MLINEVRDWEIDMGLPYRREETCTKMTDIDGKERQKQSSSMPIWKIGKTLDKNLSWTREEQQLARLHPEEQETRLDAKEVDEDKK